ncbi:hypothetical protein D9M70_549100 [compost metagenome]
MGTPVGLFGLQIYTRRVCPSIASFIRWRSVSFLPSTGTDRVVSPRVAAASIHSRKVGYGATTLPDFSDANTQITPRRSEEPAPMMIFCSACPLSFASSLRSNILWSHW